MIYIEKFVFPSNVEESGFFATIQRKCYTNFYPFQIFSFMDPLELDFSHVTILYGNNGCGKSTALNVIAEKLNLKRDSVFNQSSFYQDYLDLCRYRLEHEITTNSSIITSDDVFDFALNMRHLNRGIDLKRLEIFDEYLDAKYANFHFTSMEDYDRMKQVNTSRRQTQSRYTREHLIDNIKTNSNGENAFRYFTDKITENGVFLLDEPENSLSPSKQLELKKFIEDSARYFNCQIIMATHSPFLLTIEGAKIYNFDLEPIQLADWRSLDHIKAYYDFFKDIQI